jgi:hypothetical protein
LAARDVKAKPPIWQEFRTPRSTLLIDERHTEERMAMTDDEIQEMPKTRNLMSKKEFAAWIAIRAEAGAKIDVEAAELGGWWAPEGDPYDLTNWGRKGSRLGLPQEYFFVRDPESRGWIWQGDLPDYKRAIMQARIDAHRRKVKEFHANRQAAGRLIDIETCELFETTGYLSDPYDINLAHYPVVGSMCYVRSEGSDGWIWDGDLPKKVWPAMRRRIERECLARKNIIDDLFDVLPQGGGLIAARRRSRRQRRSMEREW